MKANELRVGNYFWESYGGYKIVKSINCNKVGDMLNTVSAHAISMDVCGQYDCENIHGISLSEEILLKCGFDNKIDDEIPEGMEFLVFFNGNYSVEITPDKLGIKNTYTFAVYEDVIDEQGELASQGVYEKEIEYVHQLQNLYFVLEGKELEIKL